MMNRINLKAIVAGATIAAALGFTALGLSAGVANAAPTLPQAPAGPWAQDDDGHGWGHWGWGGDDEDGGWRGGWGGPGWGWGGVPGPFGCVSGPVGFGWGVGCI
jgi:hypothetical protein